MSTIADAVIALAKGGVVAYPTEGVFGLGCDPDNGEAVQRLLAIKKRPQEKGLILIAASIEQLLPYIDLSSLSVQIKKDLVNSWPGPNTWVVPKSRKVTSWISGQFNSVAVRVSDHPLVQSLCQVYGKPITSTSANLSGQPSCTTYSEVVENLSHEVNVIIEGKVGSLGGSTSIRDAMTGHYLRR